MDLANCTQKNGVFMVERTFNGFSCLDTSHKLQSYRIVSTFLMEMTTLLAAVGSGVGDLHRLVRFSVLRFNVHLPCAPKLTC